MKIWIRNDIHILKKVGQAVWEWNYFGDARDIEVIYKTLPKICAICTHDSRKQLFDNLTDAQLNNKVHYYGSHRSLTLVFFIRDLSPIKTFPY
jgi:hypothetical protein